MLVDDIRKVNESVHGLLLKQYSIFHANLISRAIQDNSMPTDVFRKGLNEVENANIAGNNDVIPKGWEGV